MNASTIRSFSGAELVAFSAQYRNGAPPDDPLISPVFADLANLLPTLIKVGGGEVLLRDAIKLAAAARRTPPTFEIEPGVPHVVSVGMGHLLIRLIS